MGGLATRPEFAGARRGTMWKEAIVLRAAWKIVACAAMSAAITGCKDSRDDATAAASPTSLPTISIPPDVNGLRIKPPASDEVVLTQTGGTWKLTAPSPGDANPSKVQAVLNNLAGLKVTEIVATKPDDDITKSYELDSAHAVHVVATAKGQPVLDILFGKSGGRGEMARIGSGPIYALSGYSAYLYGAREPDRFRSRGAQAATQPAAPVQKPTSDACHDRCQSLWTQCSAAAVLAGNDVAAERCNQTLSQCHGECDTGRGPR